MIQVGDTILIDWPHNDPHEISAGCHLYCLYVCVCVCSLSVCVCVLSGLLADYPARYGYQLDVYFP